METSRGKSKKVSPYFQVLTLVIVLLGIGMSIYQLIDNASSPYKGWNNYCYQPNKVCFKYPKTWKYSWSDGAVTLSHSNTVINFIINPAYATVAYGPIPVYTYRISKIPALPALSVAGISYGLGGPPSAEYEVLSTLDTKQLKIGGTRIISGNGSITSDNGFSINNNYYSFSAASSSNNQTSAGKAWFKTASAKTALEILKSLYVSKTK